MHIEQEYFATQLQSYRDMLKLVPIAKVSLFSGKLLFIYNLIGEVSPVAITKHFFSFLKLHMLYKMKICSGIAEFLS